MQRNPDGPVAVQAASDKPPVYVVYPVKTSPLKLDVITPKDSEEPVVVGQRGEHSPLPPSEINSMSPSGTTTGNEYQNTPFTVIRQEQEPILMVKQRHQPPTKQQPFPYAVERPDATNFQHKKVGGYYNLGETPSGDIVSRVVNKGGAHAVDEQNSDDDYQISSKLTR